MGGFDPASLFAGGVQGGWWDPSDLTTMFQSGTRASPGAAVEIDGDPVGLVLDKSGNNNDWLSSGGARPIYRTSGGLRWIEGDGVAQYMRATFTITQPWERVSGIQQITWTLNDSIFSGVAANGGVLYQTPTSPLLRMTSGVNLTLTQATLDPVVVTERHNGASSRGAINSGAYDTGDAGATLPGGITVFANRTINVFSNAKCFEAVERQGTMTDSQIDQLRAYVAAKLVP